MLKRKLKKGTKVLMDNVRPRNYTPDGCFMPDEMENDVGKVYTIDSSMYSNNSERRYRLKENDRWTYTDDMFSIYKPKNTIGGTIL